MLMLTFSLESDTESFPQGTASARQDPVQFRWWRLPDWLVVRAHAVPLRIPSETVETAEATRAVAVYRDWQCTVEELACQSDASVLCRLSPKRRAPLAI